jgi:hypothetical protein
MEIDFRKGFVGVSQKIIWVFGLKTLFNSG